MPIGELVNWSLENHGLKIGDSWFDWPDEGSVKEEIKSSISTGAWKKGTILVYALKPGMKRKLNAISKKQVVPFLEEQAGELEAKRPSVGVVSPAQASPSRDDLILRQVAAKCASELMTDSAPNENNKRMWDDWASHIYEWVKR